MSDLTLFNFTFTMSYTIALTDKGSIGCEFINFNRQELNNGNILREGVNIGIQRDVTVLHSTFFARSGWWESTTVLLRRSGGMDWQQTMMGHFVAEDGSKIPLSIGESMISGVVKVHDGGHAPIVLNEAFLRASTPLASAIPKPSCLTFYGAFR